MGSVTTVRHGLTRSLRGILPGWLPAILLLGCFSIRLPAQPAGGLFAPRPSFNVTNRLVSVSVFQWFTSNGGQLSGPWRPVEGRANWTGTTNFWRSQLKQIMAANIDVLYVHLIPSSEQQRINLFPGAQSASRRRLECAQGGAVPGPDDHLESAAAGRCGHGGGQGHFRRPVHPLLQPVLQRQSGCECG